MTPVAFVHITDAVRARAFYEDVLGLRLVDDSPFALVFESGGVTVRAAKVERHTPLPGTVLGWEVPDVRAAVVGLAARGVAFTRYPGMPQDELGIWSPGGGGVAWFTDPDGNVLSVSGPLPPT
ncbi:MAG: VOC family protein [Dehalococcoidia bacterium]